MAFGRRSGYYTRGGPSAAQNPYKEFTPKVDKNPYYRTMDIMNGVFKKNIKLIAGDCNSTDTKSVITVNFGETKGNPIVGYVGEGSDDGHSNYLLDCGHEWEGKSGHATDGSKYGMCWRCGSDQSYLGFEHEWQHIIFKSDLVARALFVDLYSVKLLRQAPHVDPMELKGFLNLFINAFDDIRCNSLWEKVYPGSASAIWQRWHRLSHKLGDRVNTDFSAFVFAVAFGVPTAPDGPFEAMRPVVEWGVQKVKYRGFPNMLIDIRAVLDRCMGALLANVKPKPPQPPPQQAQQPPPPPQGGSDPGDPDADEEDQEDSDAPPPPGSQGQGQGGEEDDDGEDSDDQSQGQDPQGEDADSEEGDSPASAGAGQAPANVAPPSDIPSSATVSSTPQQRSGALSKLMANAQPLDEKEDHPAPDAKAMTAAMGSQVLKAMMAQTLSANISDLDQLDLELGDDEPDADMAQALHQLQNGMTSKSNDSLLTSNAKAKIQLIDVTPESVKTSPEVELTEDERFAVMRMRSTFFKSLGRQKAKRSADGNVVDIPALIQYINDRQDPEVFENEAVQQGFAYSILVDMSGSMSGTFPKVCHAVEMLKKSLKFPFVVGNLWGFRGGTGNGEVWMYRYDKNCVGYTGKVRTKDWKGQPVDLPVACGGLTPMHSATNIAVTHLWRNMPSGMAKRLFILTDGSPCHSGVGGNGMSTQMLQRFVAKEINVARQHGIQVYSLVIGAHSISDDECKLMFGPSRFWKKTETSGPNAVDKVLTKLVLENFTKYIKARG